MHGHTVRCQVQSNSGLGDGDADSRIGKLWQDHIQECHIGNDDWGVGQVVQRLQEDRPLRSAGSNLKLTFRFFGEEAASDGSVGAGSAGMKRVLSGQGCGDREDSKRRK